MKFVRLFFALAFASLFFSNQAFSQDTSTLKTIVGKTMQLNEERPIEKVYLHFDKPYYAVGDTIWFKAYLTNNHQLSALSKVVYVEMLNSRDSLVETLRFPVNKGMAYGSLPLLQTSYSQGNYRLRAYTRWMMNFDGDYFFNKNIAVGNGIDKDLSTNISFSGNADAKSSRINARILFKDENGAPLTKRRVSWRVVYEYDDVEKGRVNTDDQGYALINISSEKQKELIAGELVTVISLDNKQNITRSFSLKKAIQTSPDVQFFPEGGDLVAGINGVVAFKAIASNGLGISLKGEVVDKNGKSVAILNTQHAGMGSFVLPVEAGTNYTAKVVFTDGKSASYPLPQTKTAGITLSASNVQAENVLVKITANPEYLKTHQNQQVFLVAQSGGIVCYAAQTVLNDASFSGRIPKNKFPEGIAQITLFSSTGIPLSERLVFIRKNSSSVTLKTAQASYASRGKIKLDVESKNNQQPVTGYFSIAVIDETKVPFDENAETTIQSSLLLTSDLKGYIEKPNYYFIKPDAKKETELDILMMTQGYRRFSYTDVLAGKFPPLISLPEQGIGLSGTLRLLNGMPINKGNVNFSVPDRHISANTITNGDGKFLFTDLTFSDSVQAVLSARGNINYKNMMISADGTAFPVLTPNVNTADNMINIDSALSAYLKNSAQIYRTTRVLKEVVVTASAIRKKPSHIDYPSLSGLSPNPDHIISGEQLQGCPFILNCLQGMAVGFTYADNNFYVSRDYNTGNRTPAQVFLDGMPVDVSQLSTITSDQVESVETFLRDPLGTVSRMYNTNGVLVVNTKKKSQPKGEKITKEQLQELFPEKNVLKFSPMGYAPARQFYLPKYEGPKNSNDLRTTVYWNPGVVTDKEGKASFQFYNADGKGTYKAIIEGIDQEGNFGRAVYRYQVK